MYMMHDAGPVWWFMVIIWVGLLIMGIYLVVSFVSGSSKKKTPIYILKERLAKGEINVEEYERLKMTLERDYKKE